MNRRTIILLHVAAWVLLFLSPLTFLHGNGLSLVQYVMLCVSPLLMMTVFYANYLWLTPHYFVTGKHRYYWLVNVVMVVCLGIFLHYWMSYVHDLYVTDPPRHREPTVIDVLLFILRDIFNLAVSAAVATAIVLAMRWQHSEEARLEAESARTEAELKNLRSQINPHFLLNTLNNIYALTAFDTPRAQEAIQQLSKMLRHMLYDNQQDQVALADEIQFLENYVNLMKIRLPQTVDVTFEQHVQNPDVWIAPLIFISLVENAFKHGISPTEPSFIHIRITQGNGVTFTIENSNHPKTQQDRSGHGIGLEQVQRRLDLLYPQRYQWIKGPSADGFVYRSEITLHL
ncbi:MAG: sensor histidine kinase [Prevotella sp.]|nr:sensor histidine kinase [Prevotella sp.]